MAHAAYNLNVDPELEADASPQVFTRIFNVPSGMPWEQARAAQLEARHGAPLPIAEVMHRIRRLGGWAPGRPGRFAVFYVRSREYRGPFETTVEVDGVAMSIGFGPRARKLEKTRGPLLALCAGALTLGVVVGAASMALNSRAAVDDRLQRAENLAARQSRAAGRLQHQRRLTMALTTAPGASHPLSEALSDLAWAAAAKAPDSRISAVHWDRGLLAVEARGADAPFVASDRLVQRSPRPLRPGVWLWGVTHPGAMNSGYLK